MVSLPVLRVAGGHVRVDRTGGTGGQRPRAPAGPRPGARKLTGGGKIADVHVKARLADADREAHVGWACAVAASRVIIMAIRMRFMFGSFPWC